MLIQIGNEISNHGYTHWTGKQATPSHHEVHYVPQTIADGWDAFCSCGQWRGFANFYEFESKVELFDALKQAWQQHCEAAARAGTASP